MSKQWKWTLATIATLTLALTVMQAGTGLSSPVRPEGDEAQAIDRVIERSLLDVRVDERADGQAVIRLDADGAFEYDSFVLDGPDRLVLDLTGVVDRLDRHQRDVAYAGVARVRASQYQNAPVPVTRVVFDLEQPLPYRIEQQGSELTVTFGEAEAAEPVSEEPVAVAELLASPAPAEDVTDVVEEMSARATEPAGESRAVEPSAIEQLLDAPAFASPAPQGDAEPPASFQSKRIVTDEVRYTGKRISLNLVDADLKQVFRLFHEISGLNFVLDPDVTGRVTIVLDQVPWDQALDIILKNNGLDKVLENNVLRIATTSKLAQEAANRKQLKEAEELEVEPVTLTRTLSYAKSKDVEQIIRNGGVLSSRGRVIVDERTNTLIISDIPKRVEPIDTLIATLDAETPQVMIEARIVETSKNFSQDLGVVWGVEAIADASRGTSTGLDFPHNASARYGLNLPGNNQASTLDFSFGNILDSFTLDIALNALETEGRGRILSSPKIATQNNERAEIEQGVRIPIVNTTATEINVEFVSASLLLVVTPQITAEGTIILDIVVENNSPDFVNTAGGIPSIRTQRAQTKVLISDGGTTVIGGIFTVNEGESELGVPWFRKIPIFGWLFRSQTITQENRELLIFITPKIVKLG